MWQNSAKLLYLPCLFLNPACITSSHSSLGNVLFVIEVILGLLNVALSVMHKEILCFPNQETPKGGCLDTPPPEIQGNCDSGSLSPSGNKSISQLYRATPHSAGLDLCPSSRQVLTLDMGPQAIPTGVFGPLPADHVGLLLGQSSWSLKGLQVVPGVIDADYTGEIRVVTWAPQDRLTPRCGFLNTW
uniref:uncharacterized protein LOC128928770 n=1 Tax=Callithrix jacchus TaxID=9483 RepID=UPI00083F7CE2|nr:uncharacterized protein LOC128928770 [Callithrix jacchus]